MTKRILARAVSTREQVPLCEEAEDYYPSWRSEQDPRVQAAWTYNHHAHGCPSGMPFCHFAYTFYTLCMYQCTWEASRLARRLMLSVYCSYMSGTRTPSRIAKRRARRTILPRPRIWYRSFPPNCGSALLCARECVSETGSSGKL